MTHDLWNRMKGAATYVTAQQGVNRWGIVTNVRASSSGYDVKVTLQPEGIPSAWMPVLTPFGGAGWGMVARPSLGMQAFIAPDLGDGHHGVVIGMAYSTQAQPPKPPNNFQQQDGTDVSATEWAVVHKTGTVLRLCDDGTVFVHANAFNIEGDVNIQGNVDIKGDVDIEAGTKGQLGSLTVANTVTATHDIRSTQGDVYDRHGALEAARAVFNIHIHGSSGPPTPKIPE